MHKKEQNSTQIIKNERKIEKITITKKRNIGTKKKRSLPEYQVTKRTDISMVAALLILGGGNLKISDQNNWGWGPEQKRKFGEGGGPKILRGAYEHSW